MARNYFIFLPDGGGYVDSRELGLHIPELAPIQQAKPRIERVIVPGRSGSLTREQGNDIYDSYTKAFDVIETDESKLQSVMRLLRGNGKIIFSNEPKYRYTVSMDEGWQFNRVFRKWRQATISMEVFPFKEAVDEQIYTSSPIKESGTNLKQQIKVDVQTDVPCPFFLQMKPPNDFEPPTAAFLHLRDQSIYRMIVDKKETIYVDNETGSIYGDISGDLLKQTVLRTDFPLYLLPGTQTIKSSINGEMTLRFRGWFL